MRRLLFACFAGAFLLAAPASATVPPESRTLFHYAEKAWAVGTVSLGKPLTFRNGNVLVFPSQITDLLWAPDNTKPRSLMLVYEVLADDKDKPYFQKDETIFAPIELLPDHSFWKDNLPNTRRHGIAGGRRYAFRGQQADEARKVMTAYFAAHEEKGIERWRDKITAVASALASSVPVLREDAVTYISIHPTLNRDFSDAALPPVRAYLSSEAPPADKAKLVDALIAAKVTAINPVLAELATRDDSTGAVALAGLDRMGEGPTTERLLALSRSSSVEMQAYAAGALGSRAASDQQALDRSAELLAAEGQNPAVSSALMEGLGRAGGDKVVALLVATVDSGESNSRAAGQTLGLIGGPAAEAALTKILKEKQGEPALAATVGLGTMKTCKDCSAVLSEQHTAHADPQVRNLTGIVLGVPLEHKH